MLMLFFSLADQLNTTVHGTMKTTPYKLVFGQPPQHNIFPGVTNPNVMEEDIEDILEEEEEAEEEDGQKVDEDDNKQKDTMEGERETDDSDGGEKDKAKDDKNDDQKKDVKEEDEKPPLSTTVKHRNLREEADKHYHLNAERMQLKYCKAKTKVLTFSPGDLVSIRIPPIDRTSTDFHRLACVVIERLGTKFHLYRLRCYI